MNSAMRSIGFIGMGALGRGLALALARRQYPVVAWHSRRANSAAKLAGRIAAGRAVATPQAVADAAEVVFITTPDAAIAEVAAAINWRPGQAVVHCCGAAGTDLLKAAAEQGAVVGAFHPFQTFAGLTDPAEALARLDGVTFAVSGQDWLQGYLETMARELGGHPITVSDAQRPLYHAAAVMGCGYLAALLQAAGELAQAAGLDPEQALAALLPLARATLDNIARLGIAASLTGPAVRGDMATLQAHWQAITRERPELADLYLTLTQISLNLTAPAGADSPAAGEIRRMLGQQSRRPECPE